MNFFQERNPDVSSSTLLSYPIEYTLANEEAAYLLSLKCKNDHLLYIGTYILTSKGGQLSLMC